MSTALTFDALAKEIGFVLPPPLMALLAANKTIYGESWASTWRTRCLNDPPAFISCCDYEWIDAETSQDLISQWLNPDFQSGWRFLPFAESGAGDCYCLTLTQAHELGVAFIRHDNDESTIAHSSFSDFVCAQFLEAFSNLSHLLQDGFTEDEAIRVLRADLLQVAACMEPPVRDYLLAFLDLNPMHRPTGEHAGQSSSKHVFSLISESRLATELLKLPRPDDPKLLITARWECRMSNSAQVATEAVTWQKLALDPNKRMQAIRACQADQSVSLSAAKLIVDQYLTNPRGLV